MMQETTAAADTTQAVAAQTLDNPLETIIGKLESWGANFIELLPNLVVAVLIVVVFWLVARLVRKLARRGMDRVSSYTQLNKLLSTTAYVAILATGVFIALGVLGLNQTVAALLGGAGILGLALAFAFQDIAGNFMSGILLSIRRPFHEGDIIETNDYFGVVNEITLRSTRMQTFQGQFVIIPNSSVFQNPLKNFSRLGKRRVDLRCGVAYGDDLDKAERLAIKAIEGIEYRDASQEVALFYEEFGGSSINFVIAFWIDFHQQADFLKAQSDGIKRIKRAFDEGGITIPFPIRTLDFGVVGGVNLNEVLPQQMYEANGLGKEERESGREKI